MISSTARQLKRAQYVADFCKAVGCSEDVALVYLEADDWLYFDALTTYRLDNKTNTCPASCVHGKGFHCRVCWPNQK